MAHNNTPSIEKDDAIARAFLDISNQRSPSNHIKFSLREN